MRNSNLYSEVIILLKQFDFELSNLDPTWNILFPTLKKKWHVLQVTKYKKTFYLRCLSNYDIGTLELETRKKPRIAEAGAFKQSRTLSIEEELNKEWTELLTFVKKWLEFAKKDWIKVNKKVYEQFPFSYRYGTVSRSLVQTITPDTSTLTEALGKRKTSQFIKLVEAKYFFNFDNGVVDEFTVNKYFFYCKIAYLASFDRKSNIDNSLSGKELYLKFADGRHEGLLDIDPESKDEFAMWVDHKHPKRLGGGHPWEIKRGGSYTHIGLRVMKSDFSSNGKFKIELYGTAATRLVETIKMFLAIHKEGLPISIVGSESIYKRLLGKDNIGIIPDYESPNVAGHFFDPEEEVHEVMYWDEFKRYKKRLLPFVQWKPLPLLRPRTV